MLVTILQVYCIINNNEEKRVIYEKSKNTSLQNFVYCFNWFTFWILFNFQLSSQIASSTNTFALIISILAPTIGFGSLCVIGGGFISLAVKGDYKKWLKAIFIFLALAIFGLSTYYSGVEIFGVNGFYNKDLNWLGFLLSGICLIGATCLGYYLFKDNQNKNIWITFIICIIVVLICLVLFCEVLKAIQHRPRFRLLAANSNIAFHNWWERCGNYK